MTQVITESPVLFGMGGSQSLCELWEPSSSLLTGWSSPASWRCILYTHISVFGKDSRGSLPDFWGSFPTKPHPFQNSALRFPELTFLSPQISKSSEFCVGTPFLPHHLQYASKQKVRTLVRLALFVSFLSGVTELICLWSDV